jgi:hypothetical protein
VSNRENLRKIYLYKLKKADVTTKNEDFVDHPCYPYTQKKAIMFLASLQHIETMPHQQLQNNSTRVRAIVKIAKQFNKV